MKFGEKNIRLNSPRPKKTSKEFDLKVTTFVSLFDQKYSEINNVKARGRTNEGIIITAA